MVFVDIMNIKESGWCAWNGGSAGGKNFSVKGKGYEIQQIPMLKKMVSQLAKARGKFQKRSMLLIIHVKKFHALNFGCLAEP